MTFNKAIKTLERKGNGFIALIKEMDNNLPIDIFVEQVFTYGYCFKYDDNNSSKKYIHSFQLAPNGRPAQYIDLIQFDQLFEEEPKQNEDWGYYSFYELSKKMGDLKIRFGLKEFVMSISEKQVDLYGGW